MMDFSINQKIELLENRVSVLEKCLNEKDARIHQIEELLLYETMGDATILFKQISSSLTKERAIRKRKIEHLPLGYNPQKERDALDLFKYLLSINGIVKELIALIKYPSFIRNFSLALNSKCKIAHACDSCLKTDYEIRSECSDKRWWVIFGRSEYYICYLCDAIRVCVKCGRSICDVGSCNEKDSSIKHVYTTLPPIITDKRSTKRTIK